VRDRICVEKRSQKRKNISERGEGGKGALRSRCYKLASEVTGVSLSKRGKTVRKLTALTSTAEWLRIDPKGGSRKGRGKGKFNYIKGKPGRLCRET